MLEARYPRQVACSVESTFTELGNCCFREVSRILFYNVVPLITEGIIDGFLLQLLKAFCGSCNAAFN